MRVGDHGRAGGVGVEVWKGGHGGGEHKDGQSNIEREKKKKKKRKKGKKQTKTKTKQKKKTTR